MKKILKAVLKIAASCIIGGLVFLVFLVIFGNLGLALGIGLILFLCALFMFFTDVDAVTTPVGPSQKRINQVTKTRDEIAEAEKWTGEQ